MVQNSQSLYLFTFNTLVIIHEYIYPHSKTKFTFKKYINSHLTTCFLFTNIFTHIHDMYIHLHSTVDIHSHSRAKYWFNTVQYPFSIFCASPSWIIWSQFPLHNFWTQYGERREDYYMKGQNKDQRPRTQILQGLTEITDYLMISDEQVNNPVERFTTDHGTLFGYFLVTGHLRS